MAYCPKCGGVMEARAAVCPHCGYDFPAATAPPSFRWTSAALGVLLAI